MHHNHKDQERFKKFLKSRHNAIREFFDYINETGVKNYTQIIESSTQASQEMIHKLSEQTCQAISALSEICSGSGLMTKAQEACIKSIEKNSRDLFHLDEQRVFEIVKLLKEQAFFSGSQKQELLKQYLHTYQDFENKCVDFWAQIEDILYPQSQQHKTSKTPPTQPKKEA